MQDALNEIARQRSRDLLKPLRVHFIGEDGIDAGGVKKEFFQLLMTELLSPDYGMLVFQPVSFRILALFLLDRICLMRCSQLRTMDSVAHQSNPVAKTLYRGRALWVLKMKSLHEGIAHRTQGRTGSMPRHWRQRTSSC